MDIFEKQILIGEVIYDNFLHDLNGDELYIKYLIYYSRKEIRYNIILQVFLLMALLLKKIIEI